MGLPLNGGRAAFTACDIVTRTDTEVTVARLPADAVTSWRDSLPEGPAAAVTTTIERLTAPREPVAGMAFDVPCLMGIINVTPDSFSDGGDRLGPDEAVEAGLDMAAAGATIIDVGGESTRPGAAPIDADEEQARVLPIVERLAEAGLAVSIDSRHAATMAAAVARGACLINDVSALHYDPDAAAVAARTGVPVVLMHAQGDPRTMQDRPRYDHAALDVYDALATRIAAAERAGIPRDRLIVDPGIGFGKTAGHNQLILRWLALYHGLGCPVLLGASRKSFIGRAAGITDPKARAPGSITAMLVGLAAGIQIFRVHDVAESAQALAVWRAIHA